MTLTLINIGVDEAACPAGDEKPVFRWAWLSLVSAFVVILHFWGRGHSLPVKTKLKIAFGAREWVNYFAHCFCDHEMLI